VKPVPTLGIEASYRNKMIFIFSKSKVTA
jgi:hypothetical protein